MEQTKFGLVVRYPKIPEVSLPQKQFFAKKALEYYNRMGENSELQYVYQLQKNKVEKFLFLKENIH